MSRVFNEDGRYALDVRAEAFKDVIADVVAGLKNCSTVADVVLLLNLGVVRGLPKKLMLLPLLDLCLDHWLEPNKSLHLFMAAIMHLVNAFGMAVIPPEDMFAAVVPFRILVGDDVVEAEEHFFVFRAMCVLYDAAKQIDGQSLVGVANPSVAAEALSDNYRDPLCVFDEDDDDQDDEEAEDMMQGEHGEILREFEEILRDDGDEVVRFTSKDHISEFVSNWCSSIQMLL